MNPRTNTGTPAADGRFAPGDPIPMPFSLRPVLLFLGALVVLSVPLALGDRLARANGTACSAHMAGLETSRKSPVELVAFNSTDTELTLDLRLLDPSGNAVLERPGGLVVGPFKTAVVSLEEELSRDLAKKEKPYEGLVAVELVGSAPFSADNVIVHATQYFGKRKRPRGAVIVRPLFRDVP